MIVLKGIRKRGVLMVPLFIAAWVSGCGGGSNDNIAEVKGVVKLDGVPIQGVAISFRPVESGLTSQGITNDAGEYSLIYTNDLAGALVGQHDVTLRFVELPGSNSQQPKLPQKFNKRGLLSANVEKGKSNQIDFTLNSQD